MDTNPPGAWWPFALVFGVAFFAALVGTPVAAWVGRRWGLVDRPDSRRRHEGAVPRTGGLVLFVAFVGAAVLAQWLPVPRLDPKEPIRFAGIVLGSAFLFAVGLLDDRFELPPVPQYVAQIVAGVVAIATLVFIERVMNPFTNELYVFPFGVTVILTLFWITGMINTVNFLDGVDGLAAGVGAIVSAFLAFHMLREGQYSVALLPLALLGATLGFLPHNLAARIFMGSGSWVLGYAVATLGIAAGAKVALVLLLLSIPIVDVAWLIVSRLRAGQAIGQSDRRHLHFRLIDRGWSQKHVVAVYYGYCVALGLVAMFVNSRLLKLAVLAGLGAFILVALIWLARSTLSVENARSDEQ